MPRSTAHSVNEASQVVGQSYNENLVGDAFIWQNGVLYKLADLIPAELNLKLEAATGINNAGQIAAHGFIVGGPNVAVRLNPIPPVIGDVTCDRSVGVADILALINAWGPCPPEFTAPCNADINNDQTVGVPDLLAVINHWGS